MYELPEFNSEKLKNKTSEILGNKIFKTLFLLSILLMVSGFLTGKIPLNYFNYRENFASQKAGDNLLKEIERDLKKTENYGSNVSYEEAVIEAVKEASPSVVSIIISKNLPVYEQQLISPFEDFPGFGFQFQIPQYVQKGTEIKEIGAGSGFVVSADGLVLTNKHVVLDEEADYTIITIDDKRYSAKVLARDPAQDLAIMKIDSQEKFPSIKLGDSNGIQIGQSVIAIGNALGKFSNTVSVGVISGLGRTISASDQSGRFSEVLEGIIQTDAAINQGNSGGPLINLKGEVIGVNTAMAEGAESIGFAIPINIAKRDISQVVRKGKIVYPFLGVRYVLVNEEIKKEHNLPLNYGALILKGKNRESAIAENSAAEKAGLKEKDLILEFNGQKISKKNTLSSIIAKLSPGEKVALKIWRNGSQIDVEVVLGERS